LPSFAIMGFPSSPLPIHSPSLSFTCVIT
jgi:hypothetical protein